MEKVIIMHGTSNSANITTSSSRMFCNYEISEDLQRKQIQVLERKYGGGLRAHKAAILIQRAFRRYQLSRQFRNMLPSKSMNRMSRICHGSYHEIDTPRSSSSYNTETMRNSSTIFKPNPMNSSITTSQPHISRFQNNAPGRPHIFLSRTNNECSMENMKANAKAGMDSQVFLQETVFPSSSDMLSYTKICSGYNSPVRQDPNLHATNNNSSGVDSLRDRTYDSGKRSISTENKETYISQHSSAPSSSSTNTSMTSVSRNFNDGMSPRLTQKRSPPTILSPMQRIIKEPLNVRPKNSINSMNHQQHINDTHPHQSLSMNPSVWVLRNNIQTTSSRPIGSTISETTVLSLSQPTQMEIAKQSQISKRNGIAIRDQSDGGCIEKDIQINQNIGTENQRPLLVSANQSDCQKQTNNQSTNTSLSATMDTWSEQKRRRFYRVCLNIFNKKPDRGVSLLIKNGFVGTNPKELAHFFLTRRGLSRTKIGEFLGTMGSKYHEDVLESYVSYIDFADMEIDVALRNLLEYFALPGEAQKIEKILFVFSKTYVNCNGKNSQFITDADDAHILSFAIIMLNTDLHTPNLKASKRMKVEDFVKNITAIDNLSTICPNYLRRLYNRIKQEEFQPARDHVTQVVDVDKSVIGKDKPKLVEPYRRLICYCRLQQVNCISKKQNAGAHLREIFLFNDLILIVKILNRKKDEPQYTLRYWASLNDIKIEGFESQYYKHGIMINDSNGQQTILNARTNSDKIRFVNDVRESILECNEMERVRIEMELTKQNNTTGNTGNNLGFEIANFSLNTDRQRDSGLSDSSALNSVSSICPSTSSSSGVRAPGTAPPIRRLSFNSLDSGMAEEACELSIEH